MINTALPTSNSVHGRKNALSSAFITQLPRGEVVKNLRMEDF